MLSKRRDAKASHRFFNQAIDTNNVPDNVFIAKSGANLAGLQWTNVVLKFENGTSSSRIIIYQKTDTPHDGLQQPYRVLRLHI